MRSPCAGLVFALGIAFAPGLSLAQSAWFSVPANAVFLTGDSWSDGGVTYRLWGVQSCLRGTSFTNAHGVSRDCGEASLAMSVAMIRDLQPHCYAAASLPQQKTYFVICSAARSEGAGKGSRIDLGTALIATGFAFAALRPDGTAVHVPYGVAQDMAREKRAGLWAFPDLPDPNARILQALRQSPAPPAGIASKP